MWYLHDGIKEENDDATSVDWHENSHSAGSGVLGDDMATSSHRRTHARHGTWL